jgi:hypothetical protein
MKRVILHEAGRPERSWSFCTKLVILSEAKDLL